jgi:hypothetical protein
MSAVTVPTGVYYLGYAVTSSAVHEHYDNTNSSLTKCRANFTYASGQTLLPSTFPSFSCGTGDTSLYATFVP